jgi:hypothetical protein
MEGAEQMTTCAECLDAISTMRLADLKSGSDVADHCASCPSCAGIVQETVYAERRLSEALSAARSGIAPEDLSYRVLAESERVRRKQVGRWVRGLLAAAGCVTFWFFMQDVFVPWTGGEKSIAMETIALKCLTAEQASEIATPYLRSSGSAIYSAKDVHMITIKGRSDEFARAKMEIMGIDDRQQCDLPGADVRAAKRAKIEADLIEAAQKAAAATSGDKPGKD